MNFLFFFVLAMLSKIIAFGREIGIGSVWGVGATVDAFILTMTLPMLFLDILSVSLNSAFVSQYLKINENNRGCFFSIGFFFTILFGLFTGGCIIFLTDIYLKMVSLHPDVVINAYGMINYVVTYYFFSVVCEFLRCCQLAIKNQLTIPMSTIISNGIFIVTLYLNKGNNSYHSLMYCFFFSSSMQLLYLMNYSRSLFKFEFKFNNEIKAATLVYFKSLPLVSASSGFNQLNKVTDKIIAVGLSVGSLSSLYFAQQLYGLFINLIVVSVLTYIYPKLCETQGGKTRNVFFYDSYMLIISLLALPIVVSVFYSDLIVSIIFSKTKLSTHSIESVSVFFKIIIIGVLFESIGALYKRMFWANGRIKVTVVIGCISVLFNIVLSIILSHFFEANGLALSSVLSNVVSFTMLRYIYLKNEEHYCLKNFTIKMVKFLILLFGCVAELYFFNFFCVNKQYYLTSIILNMFFLCFIYVIYIYKLDFLKVVMSK